MYFVDIRIGLIISAIFIVSAYITKIVSISSILLASFIPVFILMFYRGQPFVIEAVILGGIIAALAIYRHKDNIKRIIEGTESKIGQKK